MLKSISVCTLLLAIGSAELATLKQPTWTKRVEFYQRRSVSVAIGSHLFTISHNTSHIYMNSTDKNYKTCIFPVDAFASRRIQVAVLGNHRKIVVWSVYHLHFHAETVSVLTTMLLVDPWQCDHRKISLPEDHQSRYLHRMNFDLTGWQPALQVVTYVYTFDVFFGGPDLCSPCRFSDDGEKIDLHYQLKPANHDTYELAFMESLDPNSDFRGYYQIYQMINHSSIIKLLHSNFTFRKQVRIPHQISKVYVHRGRNSMIAVCYLVPPPLDPDSKLGDIFCKKFDSKLQLQASLNISLTTKYYPIGFSVTLDAFGNIFVTSEISHDNSTKLALYHYNKIGQLVESFDLGQLHTIGRELLVQRPLFVNREFCFVTAKRYHTNRVLKCMKIQSTEK